MFKARFLQGLSLGLRGDGATSSAGCIQLGLFLACALCLLPPLAAFADDAASTSHSKFVGGYISKGEKSDPSMSLSLGADGTATVTEDAGKGAITLFGHWMDSGSEVRITFDPVEGTPTEPPMIFQPSHDGLQAVRWNHAEWGKATPPLVVRSSKIKQRYWLTTVR